MARVWVLGGGLIGCGWAAGFAGAGHAVTVIDPDPAAQTRLAATWRAAGPMILRMGGQAGASAPAFVTDAAKAGPPPDLAQECLPEALALKQSALRGLEAYLGSETILASSTSGLSPDDLAEGLARPGNLLIAHPCNPPWLMPVVELCGGRATAPEVLDRAEALFVAMGKTVLRLARPMPGHLVNRLQAALWREAVHLAREGIASLGDIERAVTLGLAPRWCLMGPSAVFHLAGGPRGMEGFIDALGPEFERWWDTLGTPSFDAGTRRTLIEGMAAADSRPIHEIAAARDAALPDLLAYLNGPIRGQTNQGGTKG